MNSLVLAMRSLRPVSASLSLHVREISGTVKFFDNQRGWGIISTKEDPPQDVFVHQTSIQMEGYRTLDDGQEVEFDLGKTERGPHATNVVPKGEPRPRDFSRERKDFRSGGERRDFRNGGERRDFRNGGERRDSRDRNGGERREPRGDFREPKEYRD